MRRSPSTPVIITILAGLCLVLTLLTVYRETNYSDFDVHLQSSSLVFNLKNNRYIEVTPVNDHIVSIFGSRVVHVFSDPNSSELTPYGLDFGPFSRQYVHSTSSAAGSRQISINRIDAQTAVLDFDLRINFPADRYRVYTVQVDYSGVPQQAYPISKGMQMVDSGCKVAITDNQTASYSTYNNDRTILIKIPYTSVMQFRISLQITCAQ